MRLLIALAFLTPILALHPAPAYAAQSAGNVYTLSNEAGGNAVLAYQIAPDGSLSFEAAYPTGGLGSGSGLGSQGAVAISKDGRWLFAVNAGSNEVSVFRVKPQGLELADTVSSQGQLPISLTTHGNLLYVLNAGGSGSLAGFTIQQDGKLSFIDGSARPLSNGGQGTAPGPAQVQFSPDGEHVVMTEKATSLIDVYDVEENGTLDGPSISNSAGVTPFGFDFNQRGVLVVSEAASGTLSSYHVSASGADAISPLVSTTQAAPCWVVITRNGKIAYTTNAGSDSVSSFSISRSGGLTLIEARAGETGPGGHPTDMALNLGSRFLFVLAGGTHTIEAYQVSADGSLAHVDAASGLPASASGLDAR